METDNIVTRMKKILSFINYAEKKVETDNSDNNYKTLFKHAKYALFPAAFVIITISFIMGSLVFVLIRHDVIGIRERSMAVIFHQLNVFTCQKVGWSGLVS